MEAQLTQAARRYLPARIRKPLGSVAWRFRHGVIGYFEGLYFDCVMRRFQADGCQFEIPKKLTSRAYRACFLNDSYEAEERTLIRGFVRNEDCVLEAGACLGIISCATNKLLRDRTKHVVVEGNPCCIPAIHRNRQINRCGFLVENCAISNQRDVTFYLHPFYIVGGTAMRKSDLPVRVPGRTLAELDVRYGPFSAMVMDIEGAELEALESAKDILKKYRLVIIELHNWAIGTEGVERCREILRDSGLHFKQRVGITEAWQRD